MGKALQQNRNKNTMRTGLLVTIAAFSVIIFLIGAVLHSRQPASDATLAGVAYTTKTLRTMSDREAPASRASAGLIEFTTLPDIVATESFVEQQVVPLPPAAMSKLQSASLVEFAPYYGKSADDLLEQRRTIARGDTLLSIIQDAGYSNKQAHSMVEAVRKVWNPRGLRTGLDLSFVYCRSCGMQQPAGFYFRPQVEFDIVVSEKDSAFIATKVEREIVQQEVYAASAIEDSLFASAGRVNVPVGVLVETIRAFSYDVDFQRDLHPGDAFELLFSKYTDADGKFVRAGKIRYAALNLRGKKHEIFHFQSDDGHSDFYDRRGQSIKRALLRTPIDGARVSSGFGMRRHPVLGYSRMHRGVDFAAPTGTPIRAAGGGVIEKIGWWGAYGKYVRIRHNREYSTAYAHASRFREGLKAGSRVKQGDVIAYVGTTGRSTGPHLHYEVLRNDKQVNPRSIDIPQGEQLVGNALQKFRAEVAAIEKELAANQSQNELVADRQDTTDVRRNF